MYYLFKPPPGFKEALTPEHYAQLLAVHKDPSLSPQEKAQHIMAIMQTISDSERSKLPPEMGPNGFPPEVTEISL